MISHDQSSQYMMPGSGGNLNQKREIPAGVQSYPMILPPAEMPYHDHKGRREGRVIAAL